MLAEMCVEETVAEILTFLPNLLNQEVIVLNQVVLQGFGMHLRGGNL